MEQRRAAAAAELEPAGDPPLAPAQLRRIAAVGVVQAAAVAVDEPALGVAISSPSGVTRFWNGTGLRVRAPDAELEAEL